MTIKDHVLNLHAATQADLAAISAIELSAAKRFASVPGCEFLVSSDPRSEDEYRQIQQEGLLGVASVKSEGSSPDGQIPVGFVAVVRLEDGELHIEEFGVDFEWQGSGVGGALMDWFEEDVRKKTEIKRAGAMRITLTTSKLTAWSFEWYKKRGYQEVEAAELGPEVVAILTKEKELWPNEFGRSRVAMFKMIGTSRS